MTVKIMYSTEGKGDRSTSDSAYRGVVLAGEDMTLSVTEHIPDSLEDANQALTGWLTAPAPAGRIAAPPAPWPTPRARAWMRAG